MLAKTLGFRRSTVYNWLAMYRAGGWSALKAKPLAGRPKKITGLQMQWLYRTIVRGSPLQYRFEFALWTRQMVRILLWEEFRLQLSLASVSRLLAQLGLSCQRPVFRASEQDPERVRMWRERDYPLIRELAKQAGPGPGGGEAGMIFEYMDKMMMFQDTPEGLTADIGWLKEAGEQGCELVSSAPLIAPNRDGVAYGRWGATSSSSVRSVRRDRKNSEKSKNVLPEKNLLDTGAAGGI